MICQSSHIRHYLIKSGDDGALDFPKQTPCIPLNPRYTARLIRV